MANATEQSEIISFKLHAGAAAVAEAAARELESDVVLGNGNPGGHVLNECNECLAVRFTCGSPTKHADYYHTLGVLSGALGRLSRRVGVKQHDKCCRNEHAGPVRGFPILRHEPPEQRAQRRPYHRERNP